jgi:hypothetical protein
MRCFLPLAVMLLAAATAWGGETNATVIVDQVEVRSGKGKIAPGAFYVTAILHKGDPVKVLEPVPENGCYAIAPPAGSYDLISKHDVTLGIIGRQRVKKDDTVVLIGSKFRGPQDNFTKATTLDKGAFIEIIGEPEGEYLPLRPEYSVRWIPVEAVQLDATALGAGALSPPGFNAPAFTQPLDPNTQNKVAQAEQLYRRAQANGQAVDWAAARQLYEELARSPNSEVRLRDR